MPSYLLAIDEGTSSTRAVLFDETGQSISQAQLSLTTYFPEPGWVEHDLEEIWQKTEAVIKSAIESSQVPVQSILAIGITNQRETTCLWHAKTGEPIGKAIVWQDRRTYAACEQLKKAGYEAWVQAKTGLILDPYFSASKLTWMLQHYPEAKRLAQSGQLRFGTIETFLLWRMTKGQSFFSDATNASRTGLLNLATLDWDPELLKLYNVSESLLPTIVKNIGDFGVYQADWMTQGVPICALIGDQQSAMIGQACLSPGMAKSTYGTGAFLMMNTGQQRPISQHRLLTTLCYQLPQLDPVFALEGSLLTAGSLMKWFHDIGVLPDVENAATLVNSILSSDDVLVIPSLTGLGAPHWNPQATGAILGLRRETTAAHLVRAGLEAIGFQTRFLCELMEQDSRIGLNTLKVDGGMAKNPWFLQWLSDCLKRTVYRPNSVETTSAGAAFLAGLGCGLYPTLEVICQWNRHYQPYEPNVSTTTIASHYARWQKALNDVNEWSGGKYGN